MKALAEQDHSHSQYDEVAHVVRQLYEGINALHQRAALLAPASLAGQEWYEQFRQKLLPQLGSDPWLVVAVVGGTNIGKSVTFNHLARCRASATSPLASGTRHPVCLVPVGFTERHDLQTVFPDFRLHEWSDADLALRESETNELFWQASPDLPPNLLVLDTPDIDSDARVNWVRADAIRRSADVLIAVLTQQKYNDAAVKEFFRKAAAEEKSILVVFNQCLLPEDEEYWPTWLSTFCDETGVMPDAVYIAPADRRAAEDLSLPFYERPWPLPQDWRPPAPGSDQDRRDLGEDLARLKFHDIRLRTLKGTLKSVLNPEQGIPAYLVELQRASQRLERSYAKLTARTPGIRDWPNPPNECLVAEIRTWWKTRQTGWVKRVNSFYEALGKGVMTPLRLARNAIQGEPVPAFDRYRESEWSAILTTIEELFDKLEWMADAANDLVKPRVEAVLTGVSRKEVIEKLRPLHDEIDFERELRELVAEEMEALSVDEPRVYQFFRQLHTVSAAVRPMTSVVLFSLGMGPVGDAVMGPVVANTAANMVVHVVADVASGTAVAVGGDSVISAAARVSTDVGWQQAFFLRLLSRWGERRAAWLSQVLKRELLGSFLEDIHAASRLASWPEFDQVRGSVQRLAELLGAPMPIIDVAAADDQSDQDMSDTDDHDDSESHRADAT